MAGIVAGATYAGVGPAGEGPDPATCEHPRDARIRNASGVYVDEYCGVCGANLGGL